MQSNHPLHCNRGRKRIERIYAKLLILLTAHTYTQKTRQIVSTYEMLNIDGGIMHLIETEMRETESARSKERE